jgi:copper chaperone
MPGLPIGGLNPMQHEKFTATNIKCQGCVKAIREGLMDLTGVRNVDVNAADGEVTVQGEKLSREVLAGKLRELGYPPLD